ncbi:TIGR03943 family putative permease subunit [Fodinicola feengrottensis]|uniref:TIGR03943 family putative permease subunit n=1 Tax=Fodinicola feengrottensis TaxID=435914 RepID=UPI0024422CAB|nr:TIGR03943 family protein [Fodinicola feengrottensis]
MAAKSQYPPLPAGNPVPVTLLDYASRAIWDQGLSLNSRHLLLTGFASPRPGGGFYLTRMVITCCAADALPIKIEMRGNVPDGLSANTWLNVVGTYVPGTDVDPLNRQPIPFVSVASAKRIAAPEEVYE